jgi:hypothetical protein
VAIEWPCIGRLLRSREKPIRAFEDFRAKSVGGRSIRKRLARSSSIASAADGFRYENGLTVANGEYVMLHGRFSGIGLPVDWIVADIVRLENGKLAEHWDVIQDEAKKESSASGLPMFGDRFPA